MTKTLILDCVDFMLGGEARRLNKPALRVEAVTMYLDVEGAEVSMYRELDGAKKNDIDVISRVQGIDTGTYTAGARTKDKATISSLWLRLMGINQDVKIIKQIEDALEQTLTVRTFYHFFVINENRISGENSILKPGAQTFTKNIPVPTITSLIYLAKELTYISPADKSKIPSKIINVKRTTAKNMALAVQEMLNEFGKHMPHLLVMDSPILSLKEREEDMGTEVTSDSMRSGLFQYMIDHEKNRQTIVLENEIPPLDYSTVNIIHFTRKVGTGRYGLIEGYQD